LNRDRDPTALIRAWPILRPILDCALRANIAQLTNTSRAGCVQCRQRRTIALYEDEQLEATRKRSNIWARRTDEARQWDVARQRAHRLARDAKPRRPASPNADPWEICQEAVERCRRVRQALGANFNAREHLDEIEEVLRQLAWGPSEDSSSTQSTDPAPIFDVSTRRGRGWRGMHNRWHVADGKPCTCPPALAEELRKKSGGKTASDTAPDTAPTDGGDITQESG